MLVTNYSRKIKTTGHLVKHETEHLARSVFCQGLFMFASAGIFIHGSALGILADDPLLEESDLHGDHGS